MRAALPEGPRPALVDGNAARRPASRDEGAIESFFSAPFSPAASTRGALAKARSLDEVRKACSAMDERRAIESPLRIGESRFRTGDQESAPPDRRRSRRVI